MFICPISQEIIQSLSITIDFERQAPFRLFYGIFITYLLLFIWYITFFYLLDKMLTN